MGMVMIRLSKLGDFRFGERDGTSLDEWLAEPPGDGTRIEQQQVRKLPLRHFLDDLDGDIEAERVQNDQGRVGRVEVAEDPDEGFLEVLVGKMIFTAGVVASRIFDRGSQGRDMGRIQVVEVHVDLGEIPVYGRVLAVVPCGLHAEQRSPLHAVSVLTGAGEQIEDVNAFAFRLLVEEHWQPVADVPLENLEFDEGLRLKTGKKETCHGRNLEVGVWRRSSANPSSLSAPRARGCG